MSTLRAALILILVGGTTPAFAAQIACESHQDRAEACTTVMPGSRVRLVEQLSDTPCIEGRNWSLDSNLNSLWTSGGCHAVFDVQPPPQSGAQYSDNEIREHVLPDERSIGLRHANSRTSARNACIDQVLAGQAFGSDQVAASDARRIAYDMFSVSLDTPDGPLTCIVDRDGRVRSIDDR
jgi:hypothetical protein